MWDEKLIEKALFFALKAHKNQKMVYPEDIPYSGHFVSVFFNVINICGKEENLDFNVLGCCALLHDTIEDTSVTYDDILKEFGKPVADGVLALSKNENIPHEKRIEDALIRIKKMPKEVWIVKMADRLFNLRDKVPFWSKEKQDAYLFDAEKIYNSLSSASDLMANSLKNAIENFKNM